MLLPKQNGQVRRKNPRLKGNKTGGKTTLMGIKVPAQGGKAGDNKDNNNNEHKKPPVKGE